MSLALGRNRKNQSIKMRKSNRGARPASIPMPRRSFLKGMLTVGTASFFAPPLLSAEGVAEVLPLQSEKSPTAVSLAIPTAEQLAWHDMELGMFIHFDIPIYTPGLKPRFSKDLPDPNLYQPRQLDTCLLYTSPSPRD